MGREDLFVKQIRVDYNEASQTQDLWTVLKGQTWKCNDLELESTEAKQACEQKGDICDVSSIVLVGG